MRAWAWWKRLETRCAISGPPELIVDRMCRLLGWATRVPTTLVDLLGEQATARYDARTLQFVDAVVVAQHENSFVTVDEKTMTAYSMDHFDGDSLLRYRLPEWKPLAPLAMSTTLHHTQGASVSGGAVWISTSDDHNGLYRVDAASGHVDVAGTLGQPGGEGEGIDATSLASGALHALVIDPNLIQVWLVHLDIESMPAITAAAPPLAATAPAPGAPKTLVRGAVRRAG